MLEEPLTINELLEIMDWSPESFEEYHRYLEERSIAKRKHDLSDPKMEFVHYGYRGDRRYTFNSIETQIVIVARRRSNRTFEIKEYFSRKVEK